MKTLEKKAAVLEAITKEYKSVIDIFGDLEEKFSKNLIRTYLKIFLNEKKISTKEDGQTVLYYRTKGQEKKAENQAIKENKKEEEEVKVKKEVKPYQTGTIKDKGYKFLRDYFEKTEKPISRKRLAEKLGVEEKGIPTKIWILNSSTRSKSPMNIQYNKETRSYHQPAAA